MIYDMDESLENAGHKLVYLKDRTKKSKPGKFSARAKDDKPKNHGLATLEKTCKKESIRDVEIAKLRISQARFSRKKAEARGRLSRRGFQAGGPGRGLSAGRRRHHHQAVRARGVPPQAREPLPARPLTTTDRSRSPRVLHTALPADAARRSVGDGCPVHHRLHRFPLPRLTP